TSSSASSREDDSERSRATRATCITRHNGEWRHHGDRQNREESTHTRPRITMPTFEGTDPDAWLSRSMQFFEINEVHKSERVKIAAYYLDGEANTWWQWVSHVYKNKGEQIRWRDIEKELITRFGSSDYFDYDEAFSRIRQTGSLRDYQKEFERITSRVRDWPESALVGAFWIQGLEMIFEVMDCPEHYRVLCAQIQMTGDAHLWWNAYWGMRPGEKEHCTWDRLKELMREKYYPAYHRAELVHQFLALRQGTRSVDEYEREFFDSDSSFSSFWVRSRK
ncbi:Unknown protein, partial [Striga hermonthica]